MPVTDFSYFYLFYILPSYLILTLGLYTLIKNPWRSSYRIFAYFCFVLWLHGLSGQFYRTSFNAIEARSWDFWYTSSFYLCLALLLHFCLLFSEESNRPARNQWRDILVYLPLPVLVYLEMGTRLVNFAYRRILFGHFYSIAGILEPYRYVVMILYPIISLFFLWRSYQQNSDPLYKRQLALLMAGIFIPLIIGSLTDEILPLINVNTGSFLMFSFLFMSVFMFIAVTRFGFAKVSPTSAIETTVAAVPGAIISTDLNERVNYCNEYSEQLFLHGLVNKNLNDFSERGEIERQAYNFIADQKELVRFETLLKKSSGKTFPAEITLSPLRERRGEIVSLLWDIRDLTLDVDMRQALEKKRAELEAKINELRRLNEFMSGRQERLQELKGEVNRYRARLGIPPLAS